MSSRSNLLREIECGYSSMTLIFSRLRRATKKSRERERKTKNKRRIWLNRNIRKKNSPLRLMCARTQFNHLVLTISPYRNNRRWTKNILISQAGHFLFLSFFLSFSFSLLLRQILTCDKWCKHVTLPKKKQNSRWKSRNSLSRFGMDDQREKT